METLTAKIVREDGAYWYAVRSISGRTIFTSGFFATATDAKADADKRIRSFRETN